MRWGITKIAHNPLQLFHPTERELPSTQFLTSFACECAIVVGESPLCLSYKICIKNITAVISPISEQEHKDMDKPPSPNKNKQTSKQDQKTECAVQDHLRFGTINTHPTLSDSSLQNSWHFTTLTFLALNVFTCL